MIAAGVNPKALQHIMGHANIVITLDRYGHLMPGSEVEAGLLDAYLDRRKRGMKAAGVRDWRTIGAWRLWSDRSRLWQADQRFRIGDALHLVTGTVRWRSGGVQAEDGRGAEAAAMAGSGAGVWLGAVYRHCGGRARRRRHSKYLPALK